MYAIVDRHTPLPPDTQTGAELAIVRWRELAAVTGKLEHDVASMDAVLQHEAIVEAVRRQGPALPVRFGTVFRDATSVATALAERYETLAADLARLGDKVELSLTALWAAPRYSDEAVEAAALAEQSVGARYLRARAAELRRDDAMKELAQKVAHELDAELGALALERRVVLVPTPRVAVRTMYLLEPARVRAFRGAFEAVQRTRDELRLLLTGPWPPYSFVTRADAESTVAPGGRLAAIAELLTNAMQVRPG